MRIRTYDSKSINSWVLLRYNFWEFFFRNVLFIKFFDWIHPDRPDKMLYKITCGFLFFQSQKQELHDARRKIDCLNHMKVEMEIEIEALTGLQQINGNLECKVKALETELNSARLKVRISLLTI